MRMLSYVAGMVLLGLTVTAAGAATAGVDLTEASIALDTSHPVPSYVQQACGMLQRYIEKSTGRKLPIIHEDQWNKTSPVILVGRGPDVDKAIGSKLDRMDHDGFILKAEGNTMMVAGHSPYATWYAATEFLRRYCGVRWFMPGDLWEVVKHQSQLIVPDGEVVVTPSFISRFHSGYHFPAGFQWQAMQGSEFRYDFHHAAGKWTGTKDYPEYASHPELFSLHNGQRMVPTKGSIIGWQVCMTNPAVVDDYVKMADTYFTQNPQIMSFSVSPNDGDYFCEDAACSALRKPFKGENEMNRLSPLVFNMVNNVARKLAKTWPDKLVGVLAYSGYRMPSPGLHVEPNVIVYLVSCRSDYNQPGVRERYLDIFKQWKDAGVKHFGIYEWQHGSMYTTPPIYFRAISRVMKDAVANGATGWYSEDYPAWGLQGPQLWITDRLLWNVNQNVDDLLNQYCNDLFGPAAGTMAGYFNRCDEQWEKYGSRGNPGPEQFKAYPPEVLHELRAMLNKALEQTSGDKIEHERVEFFSKAFGLSEITAARNAAGEAAMNALKKHDTAGAIKALESVAGEDPFLYVKNVLDPIPMIYYYKSNTVDRDFGASDRNVLRARMELVNEVVAKMEPGLLGGTAPTTAEQFDGILSKSMESALPQARGGALVERIKNLAGRMVEIPHSAAAPRIDGDLDDPAWQLAKPQSGFVSIGAAYPARCPTTFRLLYSGDRLYLAAECYQNMTAPKATAAKCQGNPWLDDAIEMQVNLPNAKTSNNIAVLIVNIANSTFYMYDHKPRCNKDVTSATKRHKDHWTLEYSVPLKDMGLDPTGHPNVRINVVRDAWGAYTGELSSWYPVDFATAALDARGWGLFEPGR